MKTRTIHLHPDDNVAIAVDGAKPGEFAAGLVLTNVIPRGHKVATKAIELGAPVRKFGQIIGFASAPIVPGDWVHEHNVVLHEFKRDYQFAVEGDAKDAEDRVPPATFEGYLRSSGKTGTRNYLGILTSVNCAASVARIAAQEIQQSGLLKEFGNIDGVVAIVHGTGCGQAAYGENFDILQRTQWGYASHPNFAGVVMVGLGCEVFQIGRMKEVYGIEESDTFRSLTIQAQGGTRKTVEAIVDAIRSMAPIASRARRRTRPASELVLALQCGGSDGYSGLTANPALGVASDLLVRHGGTSILSETPEIYGAEHLLTRRAVSRNVGERLLERIAWWERYTAKNDGEMNNNPTPGNKAGGITTILEKSLGAVAKSGQSPLRAVYEYGESVTERGLVYMDTPGFDPVAATGQVAGGANVIAFTTGRGSAFGCKPTPSLKIASTSQLYRAMPEDMDVDCGDILGGVPHSRKGEEIFQMILATASGNPTKSEALGYGDSEFVPWQVGTVM
ncbi:MAG: altronate dehydratase [Mesorhizobium sp.]|nr:MAG: altronate dehydratase [Mesorhizobium sp.]